MGVAAKYKQAGHQQVSRQSIQVAFCTLGWAACVSRLSKRPAAGLVLVVPAWQYPQLLHLFDGQDGRLGELADIAVGRRDCGCCSTIFLQG